jgi:hypothetical protein
MGEINDALGEQFRKADLENEDRWEKHASEAAERSIRALQVCRYLPSAQESRFYAAHHTCWRVVLQAIAEIEKHRAAGRLSASVTGGASPGAVSAAIARAQARGDAKAAQVRC